MQMIINKIVTSLCCCITLISNRHIISNEWKLFDHLPYEQVKSFINKDSFVEHNKGITIDLVIHEILTNTKF